MVVFGLMNRVEKIETHELMLQRSLLHTALIMYVHVCTYPSLQEAASS